MIWHLHQYEMTTMISPVTIGPHQSYYNNIEHISYGVYYIPMTFIIWLVDFTS